MPSVRLSRPFDAYKGNDAYIFVSYAHKDAKFVYSDLLTLYNLGYRIWYDEGIDPGKEWPEDVAKALERCTIFIVYVSKNSVNSRNVRDEINFAIEKKKILLAIHLKNTKLPVGIELRLASYQAILKYQHTDETYLRKIKTFLPETVRNENAGKHSITKKSIRVPAWGFILGGALLVSLLTIILVFGNYLGGVLENNTSKIITQENDISPSAIISTQGSSTTNNIPTLEPIWKEGDILFTDNFSEGKTSQWFFAQPWNVIKDETGNYVLESDGIQFSTAQIVNSSHWQDYSFEAKVKILQPVSASSNAGDLFIVNFRNQKNPSYNLNIKTVSLSFFHESKELNNENFNLPINSWFKIRLEVTGKKVRGYIDDVQVIEMEDNDIPLEGGVSIDVWPNIKIWFDDIRVAEMLY